MPLFDPGNRIVFVPSSSRWAGSSLAACLLRPILLLLVAAVGGAVVYAAPASAQLSRAEVRCRKALGRGAKQVVATLTAEQRRCHVQRMLGRIPDSTNCNVTSELPGAARVARAITSASRNAERGCSRVDAPASLGYASCPAPCESESMADFVGVAGCVACVVENRAFLLSTDLSGTPPAPANPEELDCYQHLGKARSYLKVRMGGQQKCQATEDTDPNGRYCLTADELGRIQGAVDFTAAAVAKCDLDALAALDTCADSIANVQACLPSAVDTLADDLFALVYFPTPAIRLRIDNPTGQTLTASVVGSRLTGSAPQAGEATLYPARSVNLPPGSKEISILIKPAPGVWLHSVTVASTGQVQHQQALVLRNPAAPNQVGWRLFTTVLSVNMPGDAGDGVCDASCTLRDAITTANGAPAPVLIRFDHSSFIGETADITITNPVALQLVSADAMLDGTNSNGDPSPVSAMADRVYRTQIHLVSPNTSPMPGDCPCNESPGGALQITAPGVEILGVAVNRTLAAEGTVCCGDQDLITLGSGSKNSRIDTCRLDGGAAAFTTAEVPDGETRPPTGKDCIDADNTGATSIEPVTVINSELRYCYDRGVKSRRGLVRLQDNWIHHNLRGGVFAQSPDMGMIRGIIDAANNLIERNGRNCPSGNPAACGMQAVTRAGASEASAQGPFTEILSDGNLVRDGVLHGFFFQDQSRAMLRDDYVCGIHNGVNGKGLQFESVSGAAGDFRVRGCAVVYNDDAGVKIEGEVPVDLGLDGAMNAGSNAFTDNGAIPRRNVRNLLDAPAPVISAQGNQWQHCYPTMAPLADMCDALRIGDEDTNNTIGMGDKIDVTNAQPHQGTGAVTVATLRPSKTVSGGLVHLYGSGFDAITGHAGGVAGDCHALAMGNRCSPLHGTCVEFLIGDTWTAAADVLGVTPTHVIVTAPFSCTEATQVRVRRQILGGGESVSTPVAFCTNTP